MMKKALIIVDLQNDFMPGGALAVRHGDEVVPVANRLSPRFELVVASKDWHPANHGVFANQAMKKPGELVRLGGIEQIVWPPHCIQNTYGSELVKTLHTENIHKFIEKGTDPELHSYSTFFDDAHKRDTGLHQYLRSQGVEEVFLLGLATDYCVKFSVLDALRLGFKAHVVVDGCRGIDLEKGDCERSFEEMAQAGARLIKHNDVLAVLG